MEKEIKKQIGKRLKETRKRLELSVDEAATIIDKKARAITSYETGECPPSFEYLYYFAENNQDLNYIFTGKKSYPETITFEEYKKNILEVLKDAGVQPDESGYLKIKK